MRHYSAKSIKGAHMHIIVLTSAGSASGGARQAMYLASGLRDRRHTVHFVCPPKAEITKTALSMQLNVSALPQDLVTTQRHLRTLMPKNEPCIVHGFHNKGVKTVAYLGSLWRMVGLPVVCFANRGVTARPHNPLPYLLPGIRGFLVNSRACGDQLPLLWRKKRCHLVSNGIPAERLTPAKSADVMRRELSIPADHMVIGNICNNNPLKGAPAMLKAFARARASLSPATLVIVGVKPESWMPLCAELGITEQVRLVPPANNVANYLQIMTLLAFPSSFIESQPNVIMEGMSMGLPVIGSDIGGIRELLPEECLFDPSDTQSFSAKIVELACNPEARQRLAEDNLAQRPRFSMETRLDTVTELYAAAFKELQFTGSCKTVPV